MRPFAVTRGPRSWPPKSGEGSNLTLVTNERMGGNMRKALMIIGLVGAVSILGASSGMAANAVAVTTAAAIDGTYGLEVTVDGASVNVAFVQDDSPAGETVYRPSPIVTLSTFTRGSRRPETRRTSSSSSREARTDFSISIPSARMTPVVGFWRIRVCSSRTSPPVLCSSGKRPRRRVLMMGS